MGQTSSSLAPAQLADAAYLGCYTDSTAQRALAATFFVSESMTPAKCAAYMSDYEYFGLEYSNECWGAHTISQTASLVPQSECNYQCTGDATQPCGGSLRINIYQNHNVQLGSACSAADTVYLAASTITQTQTQPASTVTFTQPVSTVTFTQNASTLTLQQSTVTLNASTLTLQPSTITQNASTVTITQNNTITAAAATAGSCQVAATPALSALIGHNANDFASAFLYCSAYLGIPGPLQSTTVTKSPVTQTVVHTSTIVTTTSTTLDYESFAFVYTTASFLGKRAVPTPLSALASFAPSAINQACQCLSGLIPTPTPTATVTSTVYTAPNITVDRTKTITSVQTQGTFLASTSPPTPTQLHRLAPTSCFFAPPR